MSLSATIKIINKSDNSCDINYLEDIKNPNILEYFDNERKTSIEIFDNEAIIISSDEDHETYIKLAEESYSSIESEYGILNLSVKLLAFDKKDDIVYMQYAIDELEFEIIIEYGEK